MTGLSASRIKFIRSLGQKKFRQESGLFVAEGEKIVSEAVASDFNIREIYRVEEIGEECMKRISNLASPSPVLAVIEQKNINPGIFLTDFFRSSDGRENKPGTALLCLALDGVRDPGNLGTIIRLADWFGIDAVFASCDTVELYNPKVVQATMGAVFRKNVIYCNLHEVIQKFSAFGFPVYGTFLDGENIYNKKIERKGVIVMGSESSGISAGTERLISDKLLIPSYPPDAETSESLNVAIATAIICSEFRRPGI